MKQFVQQCMLAMVGKVVHLNESQITYIHLWTSCMH